MHNLFLKFSFCVNWHIPIIHVGNLESGLHTISTFFILLSFHSGFRISNSLDSLISFGQIIHVGCHLGLLSIKLVELCRVTKVIVPISYAYNLSVARCELCPLPSHCSQWRLLVTVSLSTTIVKWSKMSISKASSLVGILWVGDALIVY